VSDRPIPTSTRSIVLVVSAFLLNDRVGWGYPDLSTAVIVVEHFVA